jgi:peroxiredoxin
LTFASCNESEDVVNDLMGDDNPDMEMNVKQASDFTLMDLDGNEVMRSDFDNKVLVMFFFGNTCPSCQAVGPTIQSKIADKFKGNSNFAIIGLDQWDGSKAAVTSFRNISNVKFPLLLNASGVAKQYDTTYDRLVVVDKEGKIRFTGTRLASKDVDDVVSIVTSYL